MAINGAQLRACVEKSLLDGLIGQRAKQQGKDGCQASPFSSLLSFPFLDPVSVWSRTDTDCGFRLAVTFLVFPLPG
jgi:hypothetical protein